MDFLEKWNKALKAGGGCTDYPNGLTCNQVGLSKVYKEAKFILDIGGGTHGHWANELAKRAENVSVVDLNLPDKTVYKDNITFIKSDAHDLKFDSEQFDCVYVSHCFEHLIAPYLALCEFNRVLKENGQLILIVPHATSSWINDGNHLSVFNPEQQNALCEKAGFQRYYLNEEAGDSSYVAVYKKVKQLE